MMALIIDSTTGLPVGDPDFVPFGDSIPSRSEVEDAFKPLILSASGWRKVFAESGDEEDASPKTGAANQVLCAHMADTFAWYLESRLVSGQEKKLVLGMDSRPTGREIADIMSRVFIARGFSLSYVFISAAPEIMAFARSALGFAYISASHNPIGHNGVKFGLNDGGVLPGSEASKLIEQFRSACLSVDAASRAKALVASCPADVLANVWSNTGAEKKKALAAYELFTREVVSAETDPARQAEFFSVLEHSVTADRAAGKPAAIVVDFNGSARSCSIDRTFFEKTGIEVFGMSEKPGLITHRIVPEGDSLLFCAREIERLRTEGTTDAERNATLGYVPDCDGDRGNIVYWNDKKQQACILEAQEVFALSVIAELAHLVYLGKTSVKAGQPAEPPVAIAINDPTSMRIEAAAKAFGATVARAEVGEANVVNLARELRDKGYIVRILGEGSNGGNITHPAAVRDPLNTVFALLKMLILRDSEDKKGLFHLWCSLSGQENRYRSDFTLADIIETLPPFVTTSVYEKDAMLHISTSDHAVLKRNFQNIFLREWESGTHEIFRTLGITGWVAISNNGTKETVGIADFGVSGKGGLKIQFVNAENEPVAFIWMRGSGTEPVFRILCDAAGSDVSNERILLKWLTRMVLEADGKI